jgi:tellurite resistance protein TehA-like permease
MRGWRQDAGDHMMNVARAARSASPGCFSVVMATGIVSAALRQAGHPRPSGVLLAIAAASFVILAAASAWRAAAFPADLRGDLACPRRAFTCFAFAAACGVLGDRLAGDGHRAAAAALAAAGLATWLVLTCLVPGRMKARARTPPALTDVTGNWYLWSVGTQSLAIAAAFLRAAGLAPPQPTALAAITAWAAGIVLYLVITVLVAARLVLAGLGPDEATAPYWVAMGAASITALAAAQILGIAGASAVSAARAALTYLAVIFWAAASSLIPPLAARSAWRHLRARAALRYRMDLWMVVFPVGMYATAGMRLGTAAGLPLIRAIGAAAAWPAAAAWALAFTAMIGSPLARRRDRT